MVQVLLHTHSPLMRSITLFSFRHWHVQLFVSKNCPVPQLGSGMHKPLHATSPLGHSHAQVVELGACPVMAQVISLLHTHPPLMGSITLFSFLHAHPQVLGSKNWSCCGQVLLTHSLPQATSPLGHSHAQVVGLGVCSGLVQVFGQAHVPPMISRFSFRHSQLQSPLWSATKI